MFAHQYLSPVQYQNNTVIDDIRYCRGFSTDDICDPPSLSTGCAHELNHDCVNIFMITCDTVVSRYPAGMILGGVLLSIWGGFSRKILTSLVGLMGMGAGTLILALAPASSIFLAVGGALLIGFMTPITMGPFFAVIQSTVEPDMQASPRFLSPDQRWHRNCAARVDDRWPRRRSGRDPGLVPAWRRSVHPDGFDRLIHPGCDEHGKEGQSPARNR